MTRIEALESPSGSRAYLVGDDSTGESLLIDAGMSVDLLAEKLTTRGWRLTALFLTHGHLGHAARAAEIRLRYGIPLHAARGELTILQTLPKFGDLGGLCGVKVPVVDRFLAGGEAVAVGGLEVRVVATPGHTPGSLSFGVGNALFCGDLVDGGGALHVGKRGPGDREVQKRSWEELRIVYKGGRLYPGHGFPCDVNELLTV